ncbi:MAG: hypothetical protein ACRDGA_11125 [Bacteroidota bacterium]
MLKRSAVLQNDVVLFVLLTATVFLTRLPLLDAGYGSDPDAWRVVLVARSLTTTGEYTVSRFPGFPVHELTASLFWNAGPAVLNGITAFFSALGVAWFGLVLKSLGYKQYWLGSFALAFTVVLFINSTVTLDYLWALHFILASFYCVGRDKPLVGGLLLGLAIGCRVTSVLMVVPLLYYLNSVSPGHQARRRMMLFLFVLLVTALAGFAPVLAKYGPDAFGLHYKLIYTFSLVDCKKKYRGCVGYSGPSWRRLWCHLLCRFPEGWNSEPHSTGWKERACTRLDRGSHSLSCDVRRPPA